MIPWFTAGPPTAPSRVEAWRKKLERCGWRVSFDEWTYVPAVPREREPRR